MHVLHLPLYICKDCICRFNQLMDQKEFNFRKFQRVKLEFAATLYIAYILYL